MGKELDEDMKDPVSFLLLDKKATKNVTNQTVNLAVRPLTSKGDMHVNKIIPYFTFLEKLSTERSLQFALKSPF